MQVALKMVFAWQEGWVGLGSIRCKLSMPFESIGAVIVTEGTRDRILDVEIESLPEKLTFLAGKGNQKKSLY